MLPTRDPPQKKIPTQTEREGLEKKIFQANGQEKKKPGSNTQIGKSILQNEVHKKYREGHFIILKGRIHQEDINIVNIYAPNIGAPKQIKEILQDFKKGIDSNTLILGDFNTPLSTIDRSSKQYINKDIVAPDEALDQIDLTDICRTFHPQEAKYTFFSNAHGTFSKVDHMIGHKRSFNKIQEN